MAEHDKTHNLLEQAIKEYLLWMIENEYATTTWNAYEKTLRYFLEFIDREKISWERVFTPDTLESFLERKGARSQRAAITGLGRYLFQQGRIDKPHWKRQRVLPDIYEEYIVYYAEVRQVHPRRIQLARQLLTALHDFFENNEIKLAKVRIEQLDTFLAQFSQGYAAASRAIHRSLLRGFLGYLYVDRGILSRDLAKLIVGATQFAQAKPPRFLRPHEIQQLFTAIQPVTAQEIRTYAMLHLAYALGLRPGEISRISLDDISFRRGELSLPQRKASNPITLPLPEHAIKAIAAYLIGARPETTLRALFLRHRPPVGPLTPASVCKAIHVWFQRVGINASAYWLRHTYAQNLLEADATVFEIKEMLGHDCVQTSKRYVHIHTKLMREVLFDETV